MNPTARENTLRIVQAKYGELEASLMSWIRVLREAKRPVTPGLVRIRALNCAKLMGLDEFNASSQWMLNFRTRFGLKFAIMHGEAGEGDKNDPLLLQALDSLMDIIADYNPECVYNMDEMGLFYRLLPRHTLLLPEEDVGTARGEKKSKDRVSLVVCANATGSHKIPCAMIGKFASPACIHGTKWPLPYFSQKNAWMETALCVLWFNKVFVPEVRKRTVRKVLLIMDNAPSHPQYLESEGIRVVFLPPNCSSWKQPCDMGIIASLKKRYKYLYLSKILSFYDMSPEEQALTNRIASTRRRGTAGVDMGRPATLLDAANYVVTAWNDLAPSCIANCFRKTELFNVHIQEDDIDDDVISDTVDLLAASNIETTHAEIEAFIHNDDDDSDMMNDSILIEPEKIDNGMSSLVINSQDDSDEEETKEDPYRAPLPSDAFARACNSVVDVVDELYTFDCDDMAQAYMDELRPMFEAVIFKLRQVNADHNGSRMRRRKQMTLFDGGFNPKSLNMFMVCP
ncbi:hypothetical protein Ae201684P_022419 [Aphanomyces euteiches]|uniref:HTH CENPB-type domain-containing protein n=1 Tax=Aphanomyces euteiches TaxID=100861 RepID=A0A6G0X6C9_9STRA|nr:hypothetical protein Ae201684_008014 [Aphanomyces euteiches]KAH9074617.1 hypothetical protein Ae201684P_022419 [Aphanomyces euteiches]